MKKKLHEPAGPVALVLGGGGARGWAHLGVLRALEERSVKVDLVVGTSMGGLVGAAYAAGRWQALEAAARSLEWKDIIKHFVDFGFPRSGLVDGDKILRFLRAHISSANIEDLPIKYMAVATDVYSGQEVVLKTGDMLEVIRATIAVPGIFTPVALQGHLLVDGGLVNPVPVSLAMAAGAARIIAVDVNHFPYRQHGTSSFAGRTAVSKTLDLPDWTDHLPVKIRDWAESFSRNMHELPERARETWQEITGDRDLPTIFDVLGNSIRIMETHLGRVLLEKQPPDILINPDVGNIRFMDFHCAIECIAAGYQAACYALDAKHTACRSQ